MDKTVITKYLRSALLLTLLVSSINWWILYIFCPTQDCKWKLRNFAQVPVTNLQAYNIRHNHTKRPLALPIHMERQIQSLVEGCIDWPMHGLLQHAALVTALDSRSFNSSKGTIASMQKYFPNNRIYLYDLGLSDIEVQMVSSWCGINYRKFNFTDYPPHVAALSIHGAKAFIIQDVLLENKALIWFDPTVRALCPDMIKQLDVAVQHSGIALPRPTRHSIYAVTHPSLYRYIAADPNHLKRNPELETSLIAIVRSKQLFTEVLQWWIRCSMDRDCIAPPGSFRSCTSKGRYGLYSKCHSNEQAALNLLLLHYFHGEVFRFQGMCCNSANPGATFIFSSFLKFCKRNNIDKIPKNTSEI